jgi:hypothetical protein
MTTNAYGTFVQGVTSSPAPKPYPSDFIITLKDGWRTTIARVAKFVEVNSGLLLIMLSQLFSSLMNFCVKVLNQLDVPVPVLEVSMIY